MTEEKFNEKNGEKRNVVLLTHICERNQIGYINQLTSKLF
jgi:hypothetical protein